ncbi:MAG: PIG-L family deacetylase [Candidatus Izemoplasma sp.]|nr:PIG-L family deacetylase [Candidatus Izemoplasma sp.]
MRFHNKTAILKVIDNNDEQAAISKTTHLAIGAHQDDLEIMAYHGIATCYQADDKFFTGVTVTSGSGSIRNESFQTLTEQEIVQRRNEEQLEAARVGKYNSIALLNYPSSAVKTIHSDIEDDLYNILTLTTPDIIYTHNLADKHTTHVGVAVQVINAIRRLPKNKRPREIYGCEVWRALDWMGKDKVKLDISNYPQLSEHLLRVYTSQLESGKDYVNATIGRRIANATFDETHQSDRVKRATYAMDLMPLVRGEKTSIKMFIQQYLKAFEDDLMHIIDIYEK